MRHGKKFNHLGRKAPHRKAMLANMASSLLKHKRINTTVAKAKALRTFIEPLLTKAKEDTTHSRRTVFRYLRDKYAVTELFRDVAHKIGDRPGGYTRILKTGNRMGDNAEMCLIELVDFNESLLAEPKTSGASEKKPRTRRGKKKKEDVSAPSASSKTSAKDVAAAPKSESKPEVEEAEIVEEVEDVKEDTKDEQTAQDTPGEEDAKEEDVKEEEAPEASAEEATEEQESKEEEASESDSKEEEANEASSEEKESKKEGANEASSEDDSKEEEGSEEEKKD